MRLCSNLSLLGFINLGENQLKGEIPSSLLHSKEIQVLGPSLNQFTRSRPREIGNLSTTSFGNIEQIDLRRNSLIGDIPTSFGNLTDLQMLNLGGIQHSRKYPQGVGVSLQLTNLESCSKQCNGDSTRNYIF